MKRKLYSAQYPKSLNRYEHGKNTCVWFPHQRKKFKTLILGNWTFEAILCNKKQNKIIQLNFCQVGCYLAECGTVGWLVLIQKYQRGSCIRIWYITKSSKGDFWNFFSILYHTSKMGWDEGTFSKRTLSQRTFSKVPLAKGPPKSKDLWSKGPLHQRTFSKRTFCPKELLAKGPSVQRTFWY